jgi:hypothetical protein
MSPYKTPLAAILLAVAVAPRCNAQFAAPASIAPSLIQYFSQPYIEEYSSRLILYNADQTYVEINHYSGGTYPTSSGTYTYSIDPSNPSHATIVYDGISNPNTNDDLYFGDVDSGTQTPPFQGASIPGSISPCFAWCPLQIATGGVNVSNRCQLSPGGVAISGFVVQTAGTRWVLLRAVGATLTKFGISGVVSNPSFTLYDSSQAAVGASSVWSSDPNLTNGFSTVFSLAGAFPLTSGSDEGVLLVHLTPGAYTAVFRAGSAGTLLCEAYILPFSNTTPNSAAFLGQEGARNPSRVEGTAAQWQVQAPLRQ